jgi:hypothetical protein
MTMHILPMRGVKPSGKTEPVKEGGKWLYYPKYLEPLAAGISASFQAGMTTKELAAKHECEPRYIVNILKARGVYKYRQTHKLHVEPRVTGLIKHPSERIAYTPFVPDEPPVETQVHRDHCLRCRKPFVAEAKTIYICSPCKSSVDFNISGDYSMAVG